MPKNKTSLADAMRKEEHKKLSVSKTPEAEENKQKNLIIRLDSGAHYQFKLLALQQGSSLQALTCEAINDLFVKYGQAPIAKQQ